MGIGLDIDWQAASRICPFTLRIALVFGGFVDNLIVDDCDGDAGKEESKWIDLADSVPLSWEDSKFKLV